MLKIVLVCFVFTFAIFGVACGEESSVGNNTNGSDYSTEIPSVPEDNAAESEEDESTDSEGDQSEEKPDDETEQTPPEEGKPEEPVDPEIQLALEIDDYLSDLIKENVSMISMMTNITTTSSHDNDNFIYTITFSSSEEYEMFSMMIDKTLFQSNFEKANLILSIDYNSPTVTLTYTKTEMLYPQITEYLSELVYSKTEEMTKLLEMMMIDCKPSIIYRQNEKDFVYTISFATDLDFENAMMFFDPTAYQPDFEQCELSLTTSQSSPNLILTYSIV